MKNLKTFEDYQLPAGAKLVPVKAKYLANSIKDRTKDLDKADKNEGPHSQLPPKLRQLPGFVRVSLEDPNPKHKVEIDFGPIDIVYMLDLEEVPMYSQWLAKKDTSLTYSKGAALYYGWMDAGWHKNPNFFIIITTNTNKGKPGYKYVDYNIKNEDEMYDLVWKLTDAVHYVRAGETDVLDPVEVTGGKVSDKVHS